MGGMTTKMAESQWAATCNEQGWNADSQIVHLEGFLRQEGLFEKFAAYAKAAAAEENGDISGDPRLDVLEELGYDIDEDSDQPGLWIWTAPTDGCDISYDSAQEALSAAWTDVVGQTMGILNMSSEQWDALSFAQQKELISDTLSGD